MNYAKVLGQALDTCMQQHSELVLMGEDILDPYGGAFKVARGLSSKYPERVLTTPISEQAIVGLAGGLALAGMRPIVEIMFGDFLALSFDQIINHIAKYHGMYNKQADCPVIIRTPSGGGRGYGPTHSQSLEKHFLGISGLEVVAASAFHHPQRQLERFLRNKHPVLFVEHKLLYPQIFRQASAPRLDDFFCQCVELESDSYLLSMVDPDDCHLTLVSYGFVASKALELVERLAVEDEIFVQLVVCERLSPPEIEPIVQSVMRTGNLLIAEEGTAGFCWGSEIAYAVSQKCFGHMKQPPRLVTSQASVIPSARDKEKMVLINEDKIEATIREML